MRRLMLLLPIVSLLPACEVYTSTVPLGDPADGPFDEALLGAWISADTSGEHGDPVDSLLIIRASAQEYLVQVWDDELQDLLLPAHTAVLRDVHFLNLLTPDKGEYIFTRYTVSADTLRLGFMYGGADSWSGAPALLPQFNDSDSLRAAVQELLDDPRFFDSEEDMVYLRRSRPTEELCRDYDILTATYSGSGELTIWRVDGGRTRLLARLAPGTHALKVPREAGGGYAFVQVPDDEGSSSLRPACH